MLGRSSDKEFGNVSVQNAGERFARSRFSLLGGPPPLAEDLDGEGFVSDEVKPVVLVPEDPDIRRRSARKSVSQLETVPEEESVVDDSMTFECGVGDAPMMMPDVSPPPHNECNPEESAEDARLNNMQMYLDELLAEKSLLRTMDLCPHGKSQASRLLNNEIQRVLSELSGLPATIPPLSKFSLPPHEKAIVLQERVPIPVDRFPYYNFVGRLLGPRGMTARQLENETECKIMVRGRGPMSKEPLHVLIECEAVEHVARMRIHNAVNRVKELLVPPIDGKDEVKRKQLLQLAIMNGTYRCTNATRMALQPPSSEPLPPPSSVVTPEFVEHPVLPTLMDFPMLPPMQRNILMDPPRGRNGRTFAQLVAEGEARREEQKQMAAIANISMLIKMICATPPYPSHQEMMAILEKCGMKPDAALEAAVSQYSVPHPRPSGSSRLPADLIPPANVQQYATAAAMLYGVPYC